MKARQVPGQPLADRLALSAQPIAKTAPAIRQQLLVQAAKLAACGTGTR
jgi:hypothetical protein